MNPIYLDRKDDKYEPEEFEYFCRKERQMRKVIDLVGPQHTDVLLKNQFEVQKGLEEEEYKQLASTVHNRKKLIELRKAYLKN